MKDCKNIIFVALENKGVGFKQKIETFWALKGDVFKSIGTAIELGYWTDEDDPDSTVWKNDRTGEVYYDERIWNSGLKKIELL
jgi:hypothetical protein